MREVEENYVVPEQEFGTVGKVVKFVESTREGSTIVDEWLGLAWSNGCKALDAVSTWINLEIDRNASGQKLRQRYRFRSQPVFQFAPSSVASPRHSLPEFFLVMQTLPNFAVKRNNPRSGAHSLWVTSQADFESGRLLGSGRAKSCEPASATPLKPDETLGLKDKCITNWDNHAGAIGTSRQMRLKFPRILQNMPTSLAGDLLRRNLGDQASGVCQYLAGTLQVITSVD